jgi:hypothetical protein
VTAKTLRGEHIESDGRQRLDDERTSNERLDVSAFASEVEREIAIPGGVSDQRPNGIYRTVRDVSTNYELRTAKGRTRFAAIARITGTIPLFTHPERSNADSKANHIRRNRSTKSEARGDADGQACDERRHRSKKAIARLTCRGLRQVQEVREARACSRKGD